MSGFNGRSIFGLFRRPYHDRNQPGTSRPLVIMSQFFTLRLRLLSFVFAGLAAGGCLALSSCNLLGTAAGLGLMKLQFGCLVEGSVIDTPAGPVAVETLKTGDKITGFRGSEVVIRQIHQYDEDPAATRHLVVTFESGTEIRLSGRHRIAGIPAGKLATGDRIEDDVVASVRPLAGVSRSYDLLTEDEGYRIGGIPVNSMIAEMRGR